MTGASQRGGGLLYGKSEHTLDSKNRLFVPTRLEKELGEVFYVSVSGDVDADGVERHFLTMFPMEVWEDLQENLAECEDDPEVAGIAEMLFAYGNDCRRDGSGRIVLTSEQREFAGLGKNVVVVGNNRIANIWDAATWEAHQRAQLRPGQMRRVIARGITRKKTEG